MDDAEAWFGRQAESVLAQRKWKCGMIIPSILRFLKRFFWRCLNDNRSFCLIACESPPFIASVPCLRLNPPPTTCRSISFHLPHLPTLPRASDVLHLTPLFRFKYQIKRRRIMPYNRHWMHRCANTRPQIESSSIHRRTNTIRRRDCLYLIASHA